MVTTPAGITLKVDPWFSGLFVMQRDFQARLNFDTFPADFDSDEKMAYIREQALALTDELHEALGETGWKTWATSRHINHDAYKGELADVFIFFMNLMMVADITPSDLLTAVQAKMAKNIKRQDEGYDGVSTKCPGCKRAYDDDAVKCYPLAADNEMTKVAAVGWCTMKHIYVTADGVNA